MTRHMATNLAVNDDLNVDCYHHPIHHVTFVMKGLVYVV